MKEYTICTSTEDCCAEGYALSFVACAEGVRAEETLWTEEGKGYDDFDWELSLIL